MIVKPPVDFDAIRIALVRAVQRFTKRICILEEPQHLHNPRPEKPYFSFKMITPSVSYGDDAEIRPPSGDDFIYGGQRTGALSMHCYGNSQEEAYGQMSYLQAILQTPNMLELLRKSGIAVFDIGDVADLSQLLNTGYEGRAQMDVRIGFASNITVPVGTIDEAVIQGEADTGSEEVPIEVDVTS